VSTDPGDGFRPFGESMTIAHEREWLAVPIDGRLIRYRLDGGVISHSEIDLSGRKLNHLARAEWVGHALIIRTHTEGGSYRLG